MADYAFDKDFVPYLAALPTVQDFSTTEKIKAMREMRQEALMPVPPRDDVTLDDRSIAGLGGAPEIPIRIYRPMQASATPRPGFLEIHGGGFILGNIEMMDGWCQMVAAKVDAVVVSVEYRLAPEDPFPAGVEDCYAALCWMHEHAKELGIDHSHLVALRVAHQQHLPGRLRT